MKVTATVSSGAGFYLSPNKLPPRAGIRNPTTAWGADGVARIPGPWFETARYARLLTMTESGFAKDDSSP
jgi:hypothetical protein